tara:strand:- start:2399 stop:3190 length:792 start_codon:yes stop_codon:yes gene_type:complete
MKKNVVWFPILKNKDHSEKYGGFEYFEYSRNTWEYWCEKNDVLFVPFDKPKHNDFIQYRPQWQKCIYVFDEIDNLGVDFDQIALVDSTAMIKWDCPNFFDLTDRKFVGWRDRDNLGWVYDSVVGYQKIFDNFEFNFTKYINSGFMIFNDDHRLFFEKLKELYFEKKDDFIKLQDKDVRKGNDQTPINYLLQIMNIDVKLDIPFSFNLTHMHRKDLFSHNWQLDEDKTPFFIKYGKVWRFTGIPKNQRSQVMRQTWDMIKDNYK